MSFITRVPLSQLQVNPRTGLEHYVTTTDQLLTLGVPTQVGRVRVTLTVLYCGVAHAHVEGAARDLKLSYLRRVLGRVRRLHPTVPNWVPERGSFSEWVLYRGIASLEGVANRSIDPEQMSLLQRHHPDFWRQP